MNGEREIRVAGAVAEPATGWDATWADRGRGVVRLSNGRRSLLVLVEGSGRDWHVTLRGRRIPVAVLSWRERVLAEAGVAAQAAAGPVAVKATLPGLIAAIAVEEGSEVEENEPLLTLEAMKMQNEVRAPRAGRVVEIAVSQGQTVASGQLLLRLE